MNDGFICDDGEACGAYLSLNNPMEFTVLNDMNDLDFTTDINISLPNTSTNLFTSDVFPVKLQVSKAVKK